MKFPSKGIVSGGIATIIHPVVKLCAIVTKASVEESIEPIELTIVLILPTVPKKKKSFNIKAGCRRKNRLRTTLFLAGLVNLTFEN